MAEFMGGLWDNHSQQYGIGNAEYIQIGSVKNIVRALRHYSVKDLEYHSDWNWLIGVVEKISEYRLAFPEQANKVCDLKIVVNKDALYNACVQFIEWYNQQD